MDELLVQETSAFHSSYYIQGKFWINKIIIAISNKEDPLVQMGINGGV